MSNAQRSIDLAFFGQPDVSIDREAIQKLPYASIRAKMGRSGWVVMVLARYEREMLHWVSADKITVVTNGGRLIRTSGLPEDLVNTVFQKEDPLLHLLISQDGDIAANRFIDLQPENYFGLPVAATLSVQSTERIEIVERLYTTVLVREQAKVDLLDWEFENYFWLDSRTGFIWKSLQHASPGLPPIEIEILKPAA